MKVFLVVLFSLSLALYSRDALAYVDPVMISVIYQGLFALVMGGFTVFIFKPWIWLKKVMGKNVDAEEPEKQEET